ncbi:MAG: WYL domain-containing protein [Nautiliaceae bacterium]
MKDKKVFNILAILRDLSSLETICVKKYAKKLNVSPRSVQRYLEDIKESFQIELVSVKRGCYKFLNFEKIKDVVLNPKDYDEFEKFANLVNAINPEFLKYFNIDEKIIKKMIDDEAFFIKASPFEEIFNFSLFSKVKKAIKYSQVLDIEYESERYYLYKNVRPYKIVFAEGNWYLVIHSDEEFNKGVKFLRINFIKSVNVKSKTFVKDRNVLEFIYNFQTLMSDYDKPKFEVIVFVDKKVKRYFKAKKHLFSQTVLDEFEDGLLLKYYINNDNEILYLAKRWLPYMKIISPAYLQEKLLKMVESFK